jgi:hypothetical protein
VGLSIVVAKDPEIGHLRDELYARHHSKTLETTKANF